MIESLVSINNFVMPSQWTFCGLIGTSFFFGGAIIGGCGHYLCEVIRSGCGHLQRVWPKYWCKLPATVVVSNELFMTLIEDHLDPRRVYVSYYNLFSPPIANKLIWFKFKVKFPFFVVFCRYWIFTLHVYKGCGQHWSLSKTGIHTFCDPTYTWNNKPVKV